MWHDKRFSKHELISRNWTKSYEWVIGHPNISVICQIGHTAICNLLWPQRWLMFNVYNGDWKGYQCLLVSRSQNACKIRDWYTCISQTAVTSWAIKKGKVRKHIKAMNLLNILKILYTNIFLKMSSWCVRRQIWYAL